MNIYPCEFPVFIRLSQALFFLILNNSSFVFTSVRLTFPSFFSFRFHITYTLRNKLFEVGVQSLTFHADLSSVIIKPYARSFKTTHMEYKGLMFMRKTVSFCLIYPANYLCLELDVLVVCENAMSGSLVPGQSVKSSSSSQVFIYWRYNPL